MTVTAPVDDVTRAIALDDETFRTIVDADTRGKATTAERNVLRDSAVCQRWLDTLLIMKASIDGQLAANEAEYFAKVAEAKAEPQGSRLYPSRDLAKEEAKFRRWQVGALRFRSGLEITLLEAQRIVREVESSKDDLIEQQRQTIERLIDRKGIHDRT